jgi:hypothetical protein
MPIKASRAATMKVKLAQQLVADFWDRVGSEEAFPRQLECSIMSVTPVFVIKVHRQRLDSSYIRDRLQRRRVQLPTAWADRRVNGCLVALKGEAAIFVDGTLPPDDTRVVIAHEFGHYLADYERPRLRAIRSLGDEVLDVLDGKRPPTKNELISATLAQAHVGVYVHYMDRPASGGIGSLLTDVEETANVVASELLAPGETVLGEIARSDNGHSREAIVARLKSQYGLATPFAEWYAERLASQLRKRRSFSDILGFGTRTTMKS